MSEDKSSIKTETNMDIFSRPDEYDSPAVNALLKKINRLEKHLNLPETSLDDIKKGK